MTTMPSNSPTSAVSEASASSCSLTLPLEILLAQHYLKDPAKRTLAKNDGFTEPIRPEKEPDRPSKQPRHLENYEVNMQMVDKSLNELSLEGTFLPAPRSAPNTFVGRVYNQGRSDNIEFAKQVSRLPEVEAAMEGDKLRMIIFADASFQGSAADDPYTGGSGAFSVVYRAAGSKNRWVAEAFFVDRMFSNNWGELLAISEAVHLAVLRLRQLMGSYKTAEVFLFSDSLGSLDYLTRRDDIKAKPHGLVLEPLGSFIKSMSHELRDLGAALILNHIPGHGHDVAGHVLADKAC
ncbi:hypothetical protein VTK26DRAFT_6444 [Humicola hyalothermophila]